MANVTWDKELQEAHAAEREEAIKRISMLIKQHDLKPRELRSLFDGNTLTDEKPSMGIATRKFDPFFDAW